MGRVKVTAMQLERKRIYLAEWKKRNPAKYKASWKRYNKKHRERILARNRVRYAARKSVYRKNRDTKRAYVVAAKSKPCADCWRNYPWYVMDLDHVRGQKLCNVSRMAASYTLDSIKKEIAKCDVVCSNCHRERTFNTKRK